MGDDGPSRRFTIDPHVHTDASHDCSAPLDAVLDAAREADRFEGAHIGTSDAHAASMVGRAYTVVEATDVDTEVAAVDGRPVPAEAVRRGFLAGTTHPAGRGVTLRQYVGKVATQIGNRTAAARPRRLFASDRS